MAALLTCAGVTPAPPAAFAEPSAFVDSTASRREETAPPLILKLDNPTMIVAGHSSHASHASHASHYSGSSAPLPSSPQPTLPSPALPSGTPSVTSGRIAIPFSSSPTAADIQVDGEFMGSTPSVLKLAAGAHTVLIAKVGYLPWSRKMTVSSDNQITVHADLTPIPPPKKK